MRKHFDAIALAITALTIAVAVAFANGEALGLRTVVDADSEAHSDDSYFTSNDLDGSWDTSSATSIVLEGDAAIVTGSGAYTWDGDVIIGASGTYVVSGTLNDGSLVVAANDNSKVWILLDGVSITCEDDACIVVDQADKVFVTLAEGSTNALVSGDAMGEDALDDNTDGVIFAHDDLTINGSGALTITAGYKHGVSANDDLVITGGSIVIDAPKDGLHANDSLRICDATIDVTAGDDGFAVDNEGGYLYVESGDIAIECADEGMVAVGDVTVAGGCVVIATGTEQGHHGIKSDGACTIADGTVLVNSCYEGVSAPYIDVTGGDLTVYPVDDGLNASTGGSSDAMGMGMGMGMGGGSGGGKDAGQTSPGADGFQQDAESAPDGQATDDQSKTAEGQAADDQATEGQATDDQSQATEDQSKTTEGQAADDQATEGQGQGDPDQMPEGQGGDMGGGPGGGPGQMPEGQGSPGGGPGGGIGQMPQGEGEQGGPGQAPGSEGGSLAPEQQSETSSADTADASGQTDRRPADDNAPASPENASTTSDGSDDTEIPWIHVSGGTITIVNDSGRDADGLDSNGDIIITGGDIRVSLLGSGSNSAIDYGSESGGVCQINGGTVVACGASSMAEGFDSSSTQCSLLYNYSSGAEAGTTVKLLDASGTTLLSYKVPCSFTSVNLSCPEMVQGNTYTVAIGNVTEEVTLSEVALSSGDVQSGAFSGGFTQGGGMRQQADKQSEKTDEQTAGMEPPEGGMPKDGSQPDGRPEEAAPTDTPESVDDATESETATVAEEGYTTETLVICGISVGVLAIGLAVALLFHRG